MFIYFLQLLITQPPIYPPAPCAGIAIRSCGRVRRWVVNPHGPRIEDVHGFRIVDCETMCIVSFIICACAIDP